MRQKTLMSQTVSSLAPSSPAIVRLRVQIPSTKSSLFEFIKCDQKAIQYLAVCSYKVLPCIIKNEPNLAKKLADTKLTLKIL